jgi:hypothetical protein
VPGGLKRSALRPEHPKSARCQISLRTPRSRSSGGGQAAIARASRSAGTWFAWPGDGGAAAFGIDLKGSTHHLGSLKVLTSGNEGGPAAVGAQRRGPLAAPSAGVSASPTLSLNGECRGQPCAGISLKSCASRSAGDIQSSVCRGRPLSSAATASRRSWVSEPMCGCERSAQRSP